MPVVPHYPEDDAEDDREVPDVNDIVDRILDRDDPAPTLSLA